MYWQAVVNFKLLLNIILQKQRCKSIEALYKWCLKENKSFSHCGLHGNDTGDIMCASS